MKATLGKGRQYRDMWATSLLPQINAECECFSRNYANDAKILLTEDTVNNPPNRKH